MNKTQLTTLRTFLCRCIVFVACLLSLTPTKARRPTLQELYLRQGHQLPRMASVKSTKINIRYGPGRNFPIKWVVSCAHIPVQITEEFDMWRKIRGPLGSEGWVHKNLLSTRKTLCVMHKTYLMRRPSKNPRDRIAVLMPRALLTLQKFDGVWAQVSIGKLKGWALGTACWNPDTSNAASENKSQSDGLPLS